MQENSQTSPIVTVNLYMWYTSIAFFLIILSGIAGLYFYGKYLDSRIVVHHENIKKIDQSLNEIGKDQKMLITQILMTHTIRPSLDLKNIITQFRIAAARADVGFQGFSIKDDTISTTLIATSGLNQIHPDPVATIIAMMRTYANANNLYFRLDPIMSVTGDLTTRRTGIQLHVSQPKIY